MNHPLPQRMWTAFLLLLTFAFSCTWADTKNVHPFEKIEITLYAENAYDNPYTEVEVWVDLTGPNFDRRCYGFWDGENVFRVRVCAVSPGDWTWVSGSNQKDVGLNGKKGTFSASEWTQQEKEQNPLRRGMIKASENGHAFEYTALPTF